MSSSHDSIDGRTDIIGGILQNFTTLEQFGYHKWKWLHCTPGINLSSVTGADSTQKYTDPATTAHNTGQLWIIGRGIYAQPNPIEAAETYRQLGWTHFLHY
jgi:orotidine-5'-phosphate decarboxylase